MTDSSDDTAITSVSSVATSSPLRQIGDYDVTGVLGRGGFGVVYAAEHRDSRAHRAIKVLAAELAGDEEMIKRFAREASILARIDHPTILRTLEVGRLGDGRPYYVMDRVDGVALHQLIHTTGAIAVADAVAILGQVCDALDAAHTAGVVHRDVKAGNLLVTSVGGAWVVRLADFGVAKLLDPVPGSTALTSVGQRLGTPACMAPEQIAGGEVDHLTDIYALGVLLFHMLTGHYPFRHSDPAEVARMHITAAPPSVGGPALDAVISRAMEKQPGRRFPTARAFHDALRDAAHCSGAPGVVAGPEPGAGDEAPPTEPPSKSEREFGVIVVVAGETVPVFDRRELSLAAGTATVQLRPLEDGITVCMVRAHGDVSPHEVARVALALRRAAPGARIAARVATSALAFASAFNAAVSRARSADASVIAIDSTLAGRLGPEHQVEFRGDGAYLVPP